jgi:hypothetical protein
MRRWSTDMLKEGTYLGSLGKMAANRIDPNIVTVPKEPK